MQHFDINKLHKKREIVSQWNQTTIMTGPQQSHPVSHETRVL